MALVQWHVDNGVFLIEHDPYGEFERDDPLAALPFIEVGTGCCEHGRVFREVRDDRWDGDMLALRADCRAGRGPDPLDGRLPGCDEYTAFVAGLKVAGYQTGYARKQNTGEWVDFIWEKPWH